MEKCKVKIMTGKLFSRKKDKVEYSEQFYSIEEANEWKKKRMHEAQKEGAKLCGVDFYEASWMFDDGRTTEMKIIWN